MSKVFCKPHLPISPPVPALSLICPAGGLTSHSAELSALSPFTAQAAVTEQIVIRETMEAAVQAKTAAVA